MTGDRLEDKGGPRPKTDWNQTEDTRPQTFAPWRLCGSRKIGFGSAGLPFQLILSLAVLGNFSLLKKLTESGGNRTVLGFGKERQ